MSTTDKTPFVTIEGIDKAGKGTVVDMLKDQFPDAVFTTEPKDDAWLGKIVREAISGERDVPPMSVFHLFLADHYSHVNSVVRPARENTEASLIVCDRYSDSRYAYQQEALDEIFENGALEWITQVQETPQTVTPDMTLLLDISVEESLRRTGDEPTEIFEKKEFLETVRQNYLTLAEKYPDRFVVIDAEQPKETVKQECLEHIENLVN
jgi:dTMP kinase